MPPKDWLAFWFVLIAGPACLLFALLVPPGQVPDEPTHLSRAYAVGRGEFTAYRKHDAAPDGTSHASSAVHASWEMFAIATTLPLISPTPPRMTPRVIASMGAERWFVPPLPIAIGPAANYFPGFYVPAAIGTRLAIALGAKPLSTFISGRVANCVAFLLIGFSALRTARRGRLLLFCGLTLPATLALAASFNQDGILIASAALAASAATNSGAGYRILTAGLIFLVSAAKPPYIFLCAMMFEPLTPPPPPANLHSDRRDRDCYSCGAAVGRSNDPLCCHFGRADAVSGRRAVRHASWADVHVNRRGCPVARSV